MNLQTYKNIYLKINLFKKGARMSFLFILYKKYSQEVISIRNNNRNKIKYNVINSKINH